MIEIIPAIDLIDGKCVRLSQGDYGHRTVYYNDPVKVARLFEDHGIRRLHVVDLDGAKAKHLVNFKVIERIASQTSLVLDVGGGIQTEKDVEMAFQCGASMVTGGSIAVKNPEVFEGWLTRYTASRIILGADCREGKIAISAWQEESNEEIIPFINHWKQKGVRQVICTDIIKDGMLSGPSLQLYSDILQQCEDIYLIASGGVSCLNDIKALQDMGVHGVIVGKAIYESKIKLEELGKVKSKK